MEPSNYESLWKETEKKLKSSRPKEEDSIWIQNISYSTSIKDRIILSVPSAFLRIRLKRCI